MKVEADRDVCIQAGNCVMVADSLFDQDDDGIVVLRDATPPPSEHEAVRKAARLCPAVAIFIDETTG